MRKKEKEGTAMLCQDEPLPRSPCQPPGLSPQGQLGHPKRRVPKPGISWGSPAPEDLGQLYAHCCSTSCEEPASFLRSPGSICHLCLQPPVPHPLTALSIYTHVTRIPLHTKNCKTSWGSCSPMPQGGSRPGTAGHHKTPSPVFSHVGPAVHPCLPHRGALGKSLLSAPLWPDL